ncbi:hypothetical protein sos41_16840 [Alphaproteobacteria bacterium SO-S41]|nr:hypothetical protein sos41_16840 [Alphaproteobacteria bacterium SO-S41]
MTANAAPDIRRPGRWTNLREQAERAAASFPPLLVQAERIAQTVAFGVHGRRVTGPGDSFWQFRRYEPEDPVTAIDWRQSAKSQHVFVREREWEAAQSVYLWRDASPSMTYHSSDALPSKQERASILLLALASLLVRGGERVGALRPGGETGIGRVALRRLAALLSDETERTGDAPPIMKLPRHATVLVASDFFVEPEKFEAMISQFAASGAKGHLLQVVDPAEEEFPFEGRVRFDRADGIDGTLIGRAQALRDVYRTRFEAHRDTLARIARRFGWSFQSHRTDRGAETAVLAVYRRLTDDHRRGVGRMRS